MIFIIHGPYFYNLWTLPHRWWSKSGYVEGSKALKMPFCILFVLHKICFFSLRLTLRNVKLATLQEKIWQCAAIQ